MMGIQRAPRNSRPSDGMGGGYTATPEPAHENPWPKILPYAAGIVFAAGVAVTNIVVLQSFVTEIRAEQREQRDESAKTRERTIALEIKIDTLLARGGAK